MKLPRAPRLALFALPLALIGLAVAARSAPPPRWWAPGEGRVFPASLDYTNQHGTLRTLLTGGAMPTKGHPFFEPIGANGRACVTCHQPADAMSMSAETARALAGNRRQGPAVCRL